MESGSITLGVLAERLEGVRDDVTELRNMRRDDHHRIRTLEGSVLRMVDAQKAARAAEQRQYRTIANAIQLGSLVMAAAMVALTLVTILHTG